MDMVAPPPLRFHLRYHSLHVPRSPIQLMTSATGSCVYIRDRELRDGETEADRGLELASARGPMGIFGWFFECWNSWEFLHEQFDIFAAHSYQRIPVRSAISVEKRNKHICFQLISKAQMEKIVLVLTAQNTLMFQTALGFREGFDKALHDGKLAGYAALR
ncbi:hypothetical protein JG688_00010009 [Phytophthora aleatoria]|uniref:Uncharacterized protein n=1 Tax=Phytophthora aleatoria TaxID=2496075 RepID=A0A8J5IQU4_9STRA|nr:hypothetical protein JG688_00010009 [Phytophthora aleatoria]